jgi:hypothetical protein
MPRLWRSRSGKQLKEVSVDSIDAEINQSPEQVFQRAAESLTVSRQGSSNRESNRGQEPSAALRGRSRSMSARIPSSSSGDGSEGISSIGISTGSSSSSIGVSSSSSTTTTTTTSSLNAAADGPSALERRASIERAKSIGASIAALVEEELNVLDQRAHCIPLDEFRRYGESEVAIAARALGQALEAEEVSRRSGGSKALKAAGAAQSELMASLQRDESLRSSYFSAIVHRILSRASQEDLMAPMREYAHLCTRLSDTLLNQLPSMPEAVASAVSTYLSIIAQHKQLASKVLRTDDPSRAKEETQRLRNSRLSRAMRAAETRAAGIGAAVPPRPARSARSM